MSAQAAKDAAITAQGLAQAAETGAVAAKNAAQLSATNAATSEANAAISESDAASSATAAASSASAASTSATNAANSASTASTAATTATTQASNAATSATAAATSASNAATSETNAANSASSASTSASTATTQATNAASSATSASSSASSAAASAAAAAASYDNFDDRYLGTKSTAPTLDNDGNALVTGALYYNDGTSVLDDKGMWVYDGAQWLPASAAAQAILVTYDYTATSGQTTFTGADNNAVTLSYTPGSLIVTINGVVLDQSDYTATNGTSVVLASGAATGDEVNILAFSTFDVANTYTKAEADAKYLLNLNPSYTGTLTGSTGVINIGSGQLYKDSSGNVGIGTSSPDTKLHIASAAITTLHLENTLTTGDGSHDVAFMGYKPFVGYDNLNLDFASYRFKVAGSERMRIDSSGNLLVGTTANGGVGVSFQKYSTGVSAAYNTNYAGFASSQFAYNGTNVGFIYTNSTTVTYATSSDYRLKENIQPMQNALDVVTKLKPVTYTWKADGSDGQGFIAHELQAVVPDCVTGEKDAVDAEGKPVYQGIDTSFLVATLAKAIQEQQAQIETLTTRLIAAEEQILALGVK